jgi:hypothetical protein
MSRIFSKAGFDATVKKKKSKIRRGAPIDGVKRGDSWYKETPDPCQVEG